MPYGLVPGAGQVGLHPLSQGRVLAQQRGVACCTLGLGLALGLGVRGRVRVRVTVLAQQRGIAVHALHLVEGWGGKSGIPLALAIHGGAHIPDICNA